LSLGLLHKGPSSTSVRYFIERRAFDDAWVRLSRSGSN